MPVYNLIVIAASLAIALGIGWLLTRTAFGRIIRATADNREMAEALGVDMRWVYVRVFTLGTMLGTLGGALVIPATAAMSEMGIELIVEAFAVVVIGGLGSMRGAFVGALVVGRAPLGRHRGLSRARDAADLPHRDRRAAAAPARALRGGRRVRTPVVLSLVGIALLLAARSWRRPTTSRCMLPLHGLRRGRCSGSTSSSATPGSLSFGHALFIGIGAYTGAVLTTHLGVRHMELILPGRRRWPPRSWRRPSARSACATSRSTSAC